MWFLTSAEAVDCFDHVGGELVVGPVVALAGVSAGGWAWRSESRTGYHRGTGAETTAELGKWEHARDWVIGSFRQHTSRTGDPQLHVHNLVLNKVVTEWDGRWRKLDSKALYRFQGAASAVAAAVMETALTRTFGVRWVQRRDGHGREIAGISQELMDAFSSRRQTITEHARKPADQRELERGRRPDARQMDRIQRDLALRTRPAKTGEPLDLRARLHEWEATARAHDLGELAAIPDAVAEAAGHSLGDDQRIDGSDRAHEAVGSLLPEPVRRVALDIAAEFGREHGRAPDQAEFTRMERFASFVTRRGNDTRYADPVLLLRAWQAGEQTRPGIGSAIARAEPGSGAARAEE